MDTRNRDRDRRIQRDLQRGGLTSFAPGELSWIPVNAPDFLCG